MPRTRSPLPPWYTPSLGTPVPVNQAMPTSIRPFHFHQCTPTTLVAYVCRSFKYYGMHQWDLLALVLLLPMCQRQKTTTVFPISFADLSFPSVGKLSLPSRFRAPRGAAQTLQSAAQTLQGAAQTLPIVAQTLQAQLNSQGVLDPKFPECKSNSATDEPATVLQFTILVDINFPYFMNLCLDNSVHFTERCFQFLASSSRTDSI